jgi:hypothetical protein
MCVRCEGTYVLYFNQFYKEKYFFQQFAKILIQHNGLQCDEKVPTQNQTAENTLQEGS